MGLFEALAQKIRGYRQHSADKDDFSRRLLAAVDDGVITEPELDQLKDAYQSFGLTLDDVAKVRVQAYARMLEAAAADGVVTAEEEAELAQLESWLKIPASDIAASKARLHRLRLLTEIQEGNLPSVSVANVVLQRGELAYWSEPATLMEQRVVSRSYVGNSQGISIRIMKGVPYRVGQTRGQLVSNSAIVDVARGRLVITSKRLIFTGDLKTFAMRLDQVVSIDLHLDGVTLACSTGKPRFLKFSAANGDIVGAVMTYAINHHS